MKTNLFKRAAYLMLAAGFVLTSCSDDNLNDKDGPDGPEYEKGYISLAIFNNSANGIATKAYGDLTYGTAEEGKLTKAVVVLYDAVTNVVSYQWILDNPDQNEDYEEIINDGNPTSPYPNKYKTQARQVELKAYKLAVFLNPPQALLDVTKDAASGSASTLAQMLAEVENVTVAQLTESTADTKDYFLMGNFAGLVNVSIDDIYPTEDEAETNAVELQVERAVAKLVFTSTIVDNFVSTDLGATFTGLAWVPDVINQKTYWMRKQTQMLAAAAGTPGTPTPTVMEPLNIKGTQANRRLMYAEDPNFTGTTRAGWDGTGAQPTQNDLNENYKYIGDPADIDLDPSVAANQVVYVTENTMRAEEQWEDVTTSVLIKVNIQPNGSTFANTTPVTGGYYVYMDDVNAPHVFLVSELNTIASITTDTDPITVNGVGTTWGALVALEANRYLIDLKTLLATTEAQNAIFNNAFTSWANAPTASSATANGNLRYFAAGMNFYRVPIRHFNDALQPVNFQYGRYGVVRNNVYMLTLTAIRNYGDVEIPKPENPDDKESWLSIYFEILPWMERGQVIEL